MEVSENAPGVRFKERGAELIVNVVKDVLVDVVVSSETFSRVIMSWRRTGGLPRSMPCGCSGKALVG
jgi:hypothetical protein